MDDGIDILIEPGRRIRINGQDVVTMAEAMELWRRRYSLGFTIGMATTFIAFILSGLF